MLTTRLPLICFCGLLLSVVGCQKEADLVDCAPPSNSLSDFLTRYAVPTEYFTYTAGTTNTFTSQHGTVLTIPPAAFQHANGSSVPSVRLEFREVLKRGDMVLTGTPTVAYNILIESGGMFFLRALTPSVRLKNGVKITIRNVVPAATSTTLGMQAFLSDTTTVPRQFTWRLSPDSSAVTVSRNGNSLVTRVSYLAQYQVNWLNCDRFVYDNNAAPVQVQPQGLFTNDQTETRVYVLFNSLNGALGAYPTSATPLADWATAAAPADLPVTAVALQYHEGKFYYGAQTGTTGTATPLRPVLMEMSEEEIAEAVRKL